jgi:predicted nucleic acid-binding protein
VSFFYLDASSVLRIVFDEPGERPVMEPRDQACSSQIVLVEVARALERARLSGALEDEEFAVKSAELVGWLRELALVPVHTEIVELARAPFGVAVRALDAIHVATAQWFEREMGTALEFWTHDRRQAQAALCRALAVRGVEVRP